MKKLKVLNIVGARPQIIKASAISRAIAGEFSEDIEEIVVHTGQHYDREMSEVFFDELEIRMPDHNLQVGSGRHGRQTGLILERIEDVIMAEKPDCIIIYGDTNSTLAAALAASKQHFPVVHIEAGMRSFNKAMPEELNRILERAVTLRNMLKNRDRIAKVAEREGEENGEEGEATELVPGGGAPPEVN